MRKLTVFLLLTLFSTGIVADDLEHENFEVLIPDSHHDSIDIAKLSEDEIKDNDIFGVQIHTAINVTFSNDTEITIIFEEDKEWAKEVIETNPKFFDGPGHNYDIGHFNMIKEENLEHHELTVSEEELITHISEPGIYYLVFEGTASDRSAYITPNGECKILYGERNSEYEDVENCVDQNSLIEDLIRLDAIITLTGLLGIMSLVLGLKGFKIIKRKYVIHKINEKLAKIKSRKNTDMNSYNKLQDAMEDTLEGDYKEASEILDQID